MSVTTPRGFTAAGVTAGIKQSGRPDLALVVNNGPDAGAAAVFTSNAFKAAPVVWSAEAVADGPIEQAIIFGRAFPAQTADQADGFHGANPAEKSLSYIIGRA